MKKIAKFIKFFKSYLVFSFLAVIFLASSWALLQPGFFRAHDYVHASRIAEMTRSLEAGHFPVRWSQNFGYGFGMPLFEFYAPLPFYVGALFHFLGADLVFATKLLFLLTNLISLLGAFLLGKQLFGYRGGVLLAASFTLAPYRAVNLFIRGAISEAWGMMAIPWILLGIVQLSNKFSRLGFIILTSGLVTLMLSHNLTTLMFVPLSIIYAIGYNLIFKINTKEKLISLVQIAVSYLLAIGLSSFYLIPAFIEKKYTQIDTILGGYFHYSNHFLYIRQFLTPNWGYGGSGWGPNDEISFFLGYGQLISLFIAGLIGVFYLKKTITKQNESNKKTLFHLLLLTSLLAISLFMTLLKSQWAWDNVNLLTYIQFPWRFLSTSIAFLAVITALMLKMTKNILLRMTYFVSIFLIIVIGNFYYFRPEKMMENPQDLYYGDEQKIRTAQSGVLKDYIPVQMNYDGDVLKKQYEQFVFPGKTTIELNDPHQKLYQIEINNDQIVSLPIANFPNWKVEVNGSEVPSFSDSNGLLAINLKAGNHRVGAKLQNSLVRNVADTVSFLSMIVFVTILIRQKEKITKTKV